MYEPLLSIAAAARSLFSSVASNWPAFTRDPRCT
jgi:hypothetical protein